MADNRALGRHGAALLPDGAQVLTHCNAGAFACVGYGTALGVIRAADEQGRRPSVWVDETRPVLQGARLTAWELDRLGVPSPVGTHGRVADGPGDVDAVVVGADRIAANGDVANKIGTYGRGRAGAPPRHPVLRGGPDHHDRPGHAERRRHPVEERDPEEVPRLRARGSPRRASPCSTRPSTSPRPRWSAGHVTERGVLRPPYDKSLRRLVEAAPHRLPVRSVLRP